MTDIRKISVQAGLATEQYLLSINAGLSNKRVRNKSNYFSPSVSINICAYNQSKGQHATTLEILLGESRNTMWE